MTIDLRAYGWNESFEQHYRPYAGALVPARVIAEHRDIYRVQAAYGECAARPAGRLRYTAASRADLPAVGDWVLIDAAGQHQVALIRHVLPRFSRFSRKIAGDRTDEQIVAANIDVVWLASALDRPLSLRRIERYLAVAWGSGAAPVILLTKADLAEDIDSARGEVERIAFTVPVIPSAARAVRGSPRWRCT